MWSTIYEITENTIRKFILERVKEKRLSKEPTERLFSYIKNTIRYARIEKIITENPIEFLAPRDFTKHSVESKKPMEEHFFTHEELKKIQDELNAMYNDRPLYMPRYAVELAMLTGMRVGEISCLMWSDISKDRISINKSEKYSRREKCFYLDQTKTKKIREFPLCDEITNLLNHIKGVQEEHGIVSEFIFSDGNLEHIHTQHIGDCMQRVTKKVGIHGGSITALRKTINSNLKTSGVPTTIVASMLGHTPEVNEKYYTYDTSNLEQKKQIIRERNAKIVALSGV